MKKLISLLLALITIASVLSSCATTNPEETFAETGAEETVTLAEKESEEDIPDIYKENGGFDPQIKYLENRLKREELDALPLATEEMSYADRRQLALDYFLLQLSFNWVPNMDLTDYQMTYAKNDKQILSNSFYGGIPYQSKGTGNLYRWFEYYDEKTGVMDLEKALAENGGYGEGAAVIDTKIRDGKTYKKYQSFMTFFNQCSVGSFWGWGRIINSASFNSTANFTFYNGFIPVGYTYPNMETLDLFGVETPANPTKYDTVNVIEDWNAAHGSDGMHQCYAMMKPADLLVSDGHTMMVQSVSVKTRADGTIDPDKSIVVVQEQTESWAATERLHGKSLIYQGERGKNYSFKKLQSQKYIPFTFAEFLDPADSQDKALLDLYSQYAAKLSPIAKRYSLFTFTSDEVLAMSGIGVEKATVFTNLAEGTEGLTFDALNEMAVGSNYPISDVFVVVKDNKGKELLKNIFRASSAEIREMNMKETNCTWTKDSDGNYLTMTAGMEDLCNGKNTVTITVQLSTGEILTAFEGTLLS